jgi:hypothetical protein
MMNSTSNNNRSNSNSNEPSFLSSVVNNIGTAITVMMNEWQNYQYSVPSPLQKQTLQMPLSSNTIDTDALEKLQTNNN